MERIGHLEKREDQRSQIVAVGTFACPECDAPVSPGPIPLAPHHEMRCPVCMHEARVRDFLSLTPPTRPARVAVRVTLPRRDRALFGP